MTRWEEFFREDPRVTSAPPTDCARFAAAAFKKRGVRTVLDLGCGTGRDAFLFAEERFAVAAVDSARSGLDIARSIMAGKASDVEFIEADARSLPFACSSFDAVYSFGLLHEFTGEECDADVAAVMSETRRVLKPGGLLVLAVLAGEPSEGLPHVRLFAEAMFDEATAAFTLIEKSRTRDVGCTGSRDYVIWRGLFER